jgi:hypothetical protein
VTTFDLSQRINQHLDRARQRARAGESYTLQLLRPMNLPWTSELAAYWGRFGEGTMEGAPPVAVPPGIGNVQVRGVGVHPAVVLSVIPRDLNIVLQRLEPLAADERFDLIVATNVLVYYDVFEQSLALLNMARMLRPEGVLLTNNEVFELPPIPMTWVGETDVTYMRVPGVTDVIDRVFWYQRR